MAKTEKNILVAGSIEDAYASEVTAGVVDPRSTSRQAFGEYAEHLRTMRHEGSYQRSIDQSKRAVAALFRPETRRQGVLDEWYGLDHDLDFPLVPKTLSEQLSILPSPEEREVEVKVLEANIVEAIKKNRIYFMSSSSRVKTEQSIQQKIARRGEATEHTPLPDIYGVRVIIGGPYMATVNAIYHRYPYPYEYPWGMRSVAYREQYAETGELLYHALHMVIPFGDRGVQQLAEVQIMDQMDFLYAEQSREAYERKQGKIS